MRHGAFRPPGAAFSIRLSGEFKQHGQAKWRMRRLNANEMLLPGQRAR
jgi:hypothetical protein